LRLVLGGSRMVEFGARVCCGHRTRILSSPCEERKHRFENDLICNREGRIRQNAARHAGTLKIRLQRRPPWLDKYTRMKKEKAT
jgi:hypothetical protein